MSDMAEMPVQLPEHPTSGTEARGRYFNSGNAFNIKLPEVPCALFTEEAARALARTETALYPCDISATLDCPFPATTPLLLARYASVLAGAQLTVDFVATASIWYVIDGAGTVTCGGEEIRFGKGDVFLLPGLAAAVIGAEAAAVFWCVGNDPQLAFEASAPIPGARDGVAFVHFPAGEIAHQLDKVYAQEANDSTSGHALIFSAAQSEKSRNITPTMTLSLNTLKPHSFQPPHRHNSVALTLVIAGDPAHTEIDDVPWAWAPWATLLTPPTAKHSHHNNGDSRAEFLIVQDGGFYYHARTMGFQFL
ncbi:cupin domain-containing protein [Paenirhodobacter populi]|nr:cupin domain-containing protein [Sinirhodobacter populi]